MTRMVQCRLRLLVLVVAILVGGVSAASADNLRKIVIFNSTLNLTNSLDYATALGVVTATGSSLVHNLSFINALAIELPALTADQALASLQSNSLVEGVFDDTQSEVDGGVCIATALPPVPERYPWGLQRINMLAVHQNWPALQGSGVMVAILDTGIDLSHVELSPRITKGYNALAGGGSYADNNGHGTHMAGIIAAALNSVGVIGAAPQATLAAVKVVNGQGVGYLSDLINGLEWVSSNGIRLVNLSLGFSTASQPLQRAVQRLYNSGVIMVAAAGNRCTAGPSQDDGGGAECLGGPAATCTSPLTAVKYPAAYPWVIAVAATDVSNYVTDYSVSGAEIDIAAPGGAQVSGPILSTNKGGGYGFGYGTSQAAAHVTGAIALALQFEPQLSFEQVRSILQATATNLGYQPTQQGAGLIDVEKMIEALP